ncbi:MAG: hypothetical protein QM813_24995 [Verrucomicrobiota bacterium]
MNFPWVIRLASADAMALASLRLTPKLQVAEAGMNLWLRGDPGDEALDLKLAALPAEARFELVGAYQLRPHNQRVPSATLQSLHWQPLQNWLQVESPTASLPGDQPRRISLRLERSAAESEPEILWTTLDELGAFAQLAAQVRLDRLQFAANVARQVLVRGTPLPPLPGKRFVLFGNIGVPAGFHWSPAISQEVVARRLGVSAESLVLWNEDGNIMRFHAEQFIGLNRSAIRNTAASLAQSDER